MQHWSSFRNTTTRYIRSSLFDIAESPPLTPQSSQAPAARTRDGSLHSVVIHFVRLYDSRIGNYRYESEEKAERWSLNL